MINGADPATELKKATAEFQPVLDKSEKAARPAGPSPIMAAPQRAPGLSRPPASQLLPVRRCRRWSSSAP